MATELKRVLPQWCLMNLIIMNLMTTMMPETNSCDFFCQEGVPNVAVGLLVSAHKAVSRTQWALLLCWIHALVELLHLNRLAARNFTVFAWLQIYYHWGYPSFWTFNCNFRLWCAADKIQSTCPIALPSSYWVAAVKLSMRWANLKGDSANPAYMALLQSWIMCWSFPFDSKDWGGNPANPTLYS